ncbi:sensor histidine kinase [Phenylobacterium sp. CCH12-B4]|uniref:sensor histidine kinase n=1 Tax=Phenylobacterium sp. CCH12-B4 TaxID=1768784 RepID=UPI00083AE593|nr:histidine kinase [Phenylobacterium sp. CCH12-B4]
MSATDGAEQAVARREWVQTAAIALIFWTGMELWTLILQAMRGSPLPLRYALGHVVGVLIACGLSLAGFAALRAVRDRSRTARGVVAVAALLVSACLFALSMPAIHVFTPMLRGDDDYRLQYLAWESLYWLVPFALWLLLVLVLESGRKARRREANLSAALIAAKEAELRALHYQVNPHFLYNALNAIATLILDGRNSQAERMVLRLSDFFRASLVRDPLSEVKLADEVAQQRLYLELEELRFPDCLRVVVEVPEDLAGAEVPSLILQPLVENAVKHGVHAPGQETRIEIAARAESGMLVLQVADNGPGGGGAAGTGVGIANVRRRLRAHFGAAARLEAGPHPERGYVATLFLPLRFAAG